MSPLALRLLELIVVKLITVLLESNLKRTNGDPATVSEAEAEARLARIREAYQNAFDGTTVTPEQRKKLHASIAEFIRGRPGSGM